MTKRGNWGKRLLRRMVRRGTALSRDEKGAVAVEFGILAVPFFALIFAIIETAMAFFAQQVLESAVQDATRIIRTGQSQAGWNATTFREAVCDASYGFINCDSAEGRLVIKVSPAASFDAAGDQITRPVSDECTVLADPSKCNWQIAESFDDGVGNDVIIAQAFYKWPTFINLPWFNLATQAGGNRLLSAVRVFKNEPF